MMKLSEEKCCNCDGRFPPHRVICQHCHERSVALRKALLDIVWNTDGIPIEYPTQGRVYALLTAEFTGGTTPAYFSAQNKEESE